MSSWVYDIGSHGLLLGKFGSYVPGSVEVDRICIECLSPKVDWHVENTVTCCRAMFLEGWVKKGCLELWSIIAPRPSVFLNTPGVSDLDKLGVLVLECTEHGVGVSSHNVIDCFVTVGSHWISFVLILVDPVEMGGV